jgi:hypothetical protein
VLKLLPSHTLGISNLRLGVTIAIAISAIVLVIPFLAAQPAGVPGDRRWYRWRGRLLLLAGFVLAWLALLPPTRLAISAGWPLEGVSAQRALGWTPAVLAALLFIPFLLLERRLDRYPYAPATLWGFVLVSACLGYTAWEGFGPYAAVAALPVLWLLLLVCGFPPPGGIRSRLVPLATAAIMFASFGMLVLLAAPDAVGLSAHEPPLGQGTIEEGVSHLQRTATLWQFAAAMAACGLLLFTAHRQVRYHQQMRSVGLIGEQDRRHPPIPSDGGDVLA